MKTLKFGSSGLEIVDAELQMISDHEEIAQSARIALSINKGEWFLNPDLGIDQSAFTGKNPSEAVMQDEIRSLLLEHVEDIQSVDEVIIEKDTVARTMAVSFKATAASGQMITDKAVTIDAG